MKKLLTFLIIAYLSFTINSSKANEDKKNLEMATHLLFVTKNIERAGDHITNIAESLYYLIEGEYLEGARPKGKPVES